MNFWVWALATLLIQESASTSASMTVAYQNHHNIYFFCGFFLFATIVEIIAAHRLSLYLKRKNLSIKYLKFITKYIDKAVGLVSIHEKKIFILILSSSVFPAYITTLVTSCFNLPFRTVFIYNLLGNILWFIVLWTVVIGVNKVVTDPQALLLKTLIVVLLIFIVQKIIYRIIKNKIS
nr:hypothetical protein [uncultured Mucilaginibacter sp.]